MPYTTISDDALQFNRPLASATMRALRDNITHVYEGTQLQVQLPSTSVAFGITYCRTTIASIAPSGGTLLGVRVVGTPSTVGGTLLSFRANPNDAGGINFSAVVSGEQSRVTANVIPIIGQFGGLST